MSSDGGNETPIFAVLFTPLGINVKDGAASTACKAVPEVVVKVNTQKPYGKTDHNKSSWTDRFQSKRAAAK